jgi:phosphoglycolate phosphatase-like HAD superfamily hydrolase
VSRRVVHPVLMRARDDAEAVEDSSSLQTSSSPGLRLVHPGLAELDVRSQAAEVESLARWTFEDRRSSMGVSIAVFDAKKRASRWSNQQRRKYRKVAYLYGCLVDYSTHKVDASWAWLAGRYLEIHHERIGVSTLRRLASEMRQLGLLEISENWSTYEDEEYAGRQRWNTYTIHVGLAVGNDSTLAVHDWNAPLADRQERVLAECQHCGTTFDPKRPDAKYCSTRCRKAASRERVTDNEHLGEHLPEHLNEHPNQFSISYPIGSSSSSSRSDDDEDEPDQDLQEQVPSSPSVRVEANSRRTSARPRAERGTDLPEEMTDLLPEDMTLSVWSRKIAGDDVDEVIQMLRNWVAGRLQGFGPRLGSGGLIDFHEEMMAGHRLIAQRVEEARERERQEAEERARLAEERERQEREGKVIRAEVLPRVKELLAQINAAYKAKYPTARTSDSVGDFLEDAGCAMPQRAYVRAEDVPAADLPKLESYLIWCLAEWQKPDETIG